LVVNVEKPDAKDSKDRLNFTMDDKARVGSNKAGEDSGNSYFVRMKLIRILQTPGADPHRSGFLINGLLLPLHSEAVLPQRSGVYFLGHVDATVQEREVGVKAAIPALMGGRWYSLFRVVPLTSQLAMPSTNKPCWP